MADAKTCTYYSKNIANVSIRLVELEKRV